MCDQMCNPVMSGAEMKLNNDDIWNQFHEHTTEMIITKSGRRMFPYLRLEAAGLDPDARYFVLLELNLSSGKRYKFNGAQWTPIGNAEPQLPPASRLYIHPDSPALGRHWMSQSILFNKVKLTNHTLDRSGNIVLTSMHKYMPTIHLVMASDVLAVHWSPTASFRFKETEFVAVTAYQNEKITKLKIDNNPFAKGFRETGQSRLKRRLQPSKDKDDDIHEMKKRSSPLSVTPTPDSGISSIGSPVERCSLSDEDTKHNTSLLSCPEDNYDRHLLANRFSPPMSSYTTPPQHHIHHTPWMDLPLPPYPLIPPYCPPSTFPPSLWPYPPFLLPRTMSFPSENSFTSALSPSSSTSAFSSPPYHQHKFFLPPHLIPYLPPTLPTPPVSEPGNKRMRKKENRKNAEKEGEASKETSSTKRASNYISYLKKDELQEIRIILNTDVLDDCDLLQGAVAIGNFSVVKRLLKHGCQINCCGKNGWTCLMWAVKFKRFEMIDLLIKRSADIAAANTEGDNAMLLAIQSDCWHQDAFLDLLNTISRFSSSFKEVVNHANKKGYTLLHLSVKRQWENIVDRLIDDGANVDCINQRGITPLIIAGYSGDLSLIRRLLRSKANVLLEDKRGCTAVCYAIAFMLPKHAEISHTLNDQLADEFSIFPPMMVTKELYLKRRLDLLVYPPSEDFPSTIRKVIVPLMTFFVRFNKDGLLLYTEQQIFGKIHEAIDRHIENADYLKALMSVTLELVRDCQCCINKFLPAEVGKSFVGAGLPEACLRILKRHNQTSMNESVIKATLLPLVSVCTSRGLPGKVWLQNNFKNLIPFYHKCNIIKDKSFKILADDIHRNLLKQSVKDFAKLVKSLESGKLIVQNMEGLKLEENLSKNGSDGNCSTISNSRSVSPSFIDFLSEKCTLETKVRNSNEQSIFTKHEELKQSSQHNNIKGPKTTEGYTNLTELFMSRKISDSKKTQLLQKLATRSYLEETSVETLKAENKIGEVINENKVKNNINSCYKPTNDSRIENGKTFSSVLQKSMKIETSSKCFLTNPNQKPNSELFMDDIAMKLNANLEETSTEDTKPLGEMNAPGPFATKSDEDMKIDSFLESNCVKDIEGRYKNPISNYLWSLDVYDSNPITERSNVSEFNGIALETNLPVFEDKYNLDCYTYYEADHDAKLKSKAEATIEAEFENETKNSVYYNEKNQILSQFERDFPAFENNPKNNFSYNDREECKNEANYSKIFYNYKENSTNQIAEKTKADPRIFKDNCYINYSDNQKAYHKNNYDNVFEEVDRIDYVFEGGDVYMFDNDNLLNYQYQKCETEVMNCDLSNSRNILNSGINDAENRENITENFEKEFCVENSEPDIIVEHEFSTLSTKESNNKKKECSLNAVDAQMEKLDMQVKHIINQYETLCRKDFENGYPKAQGDEARLLELMVSLPLVELSHLQNLKQKWDELRKKLTTKIQQNLNGVVEKVEKYLQNFSKSLEKKIEEYGILKEPRLPDIGEDLKNSGFNYDFDEKFEDRFWDTNDKLIIKQYVGEKYASFEPDYWYTAYNEPLNFSKNYEVDENLEEAFKDEYSQFKKTKCFEQRNFLNREDIYGKGDFNRIHQTGFISEVNRKFVREDHERLLKEDRKSMYCSQTHLDSIINLMNLNENKKEIFGNGTLIMAALSTYPEYKLKNGGNHGSIKLGLDQEGYPLAVKRIIPCKTKTMEMITSTLRSSLCEMSNLHHPNIVHYVNYVETEFNVMIALPLCEKNLNEYIEELKECDGVGNRSLDLVQQMMKGLQYLHSCTPPIIHGNLKPTNILIDSKQTVRLADFGLHKMVCTLQSDIQVAGILMHYILTGGIHPFGRSNSILMEDPSALAPILHTTNCEANDLLTWMLEDVNNRPNIDQALRKN
ncbi:hypothetical protein LSTR_LSTR007947 [Laodelphax striatellus]|uniref:Non-specific serine/threonine protein kinase n=1 Tax=Laodelphax striatellus TaxID=195883 RepID=A0A482XF82_LAOST|nr:hypothetical protein LSTR_LSTR007947 [Laodelphax striatellus]